MSWPARVRAAGEPAWQPGQVVNLSVTGVLLRIDHQYQIGERVEVEIDFLTKPEGTMVVSGVGYVVREDQIVAGGAAVQFLVECGLARRNADDPSANEPPAN